MRRNIIASSNTISIFETDTIGYEDTRTASEAVLVLLQPLSVWGFRVVST